MDRSASVFPVHRQLLELTQTYVHQVGDAINHLILCCPLLFPPSIFPSIRVFSNESVLRIRWPKYWHFSFSISPSKEYSGLISFRIDWVNLLIVQRTLKSLLQHHSLKVRFFGAQPDCNSAINNDNPVSLEKTLRVFLFHCGFQEAQGQIIS